MKTLVLIRHAKSSWDAAGLADFDRPLNDRGKKDAPDMAHRLAKHKIKPDLFIASPAKRAKKTAELFIKELKADSRQLMLVAELYEAETKTFYDVLSRLKPTLTVVALFSHNPGITAFANSLTQVQIDDMATCGVFAITVASKTWSDFPVASKAFVFYDYPKSGN